MDFQKSKLKMKKTILGLSIVLTLSVACNKNSTNQGISSETKTEKKTRKPKPTTTQWFNSGIRLCVPPAYNCASEVKIKPHKDAFQFLDEAIISGTNAVTSFFNTNNGSIIISEYFGDEYASVLRNGVYIVISAYNSETATRFYLLGEASSLNLDNAELVIPTID